MRTLGEISEAALNLPERERGLLAQQLLRSLPEPPGIDDEELKDLLASRIAAIECGEMEVFESEDALAQLRRQLSESRRRS